MFAPGDFVTNAQFAGCMLLKRVMKILLAVLFAFPLTLRAQSITINSVTQLGSCEHDLVLVSYTATGSFEQGNLFKVQLSDANGSFNNFSYQGGSGLMSDTIYLSPAPGKYRVKVISTSPFKT